MGIEFGIYKRILKPFLSYYIRIKNCLMQLWITTFY